MIAECGCSANVTSIWASRALSRSSRARIPLASSVMMLAAVPEASLMAYENLIGAELVTVRASRRRVGDPVPGGGLNQIAQHGMKPIVPRFLDHALLRRWRVGAW